MIRNSFPVQVWQIIHHSFFSRRHVREHYIARQHFPRMQRSQLRPDSAPADASE